jgi:subfamily B ATP-binding cassette protein MsbA
MDNIFKEISGKEWKNDAYTVWALTRKHLRILIAAIICGSLLSLINGAVAWVVKPAIDLVSDARDSSIIIWLPVGVFVLFALRGFFTFGNNFLMNSMSAKIVRYLRKTLYEKLLRLPMAFYSNKNSGSVISRMVNDIDSMEKPVANLSKDFFVQTATVIVLAVVALIRRWDLALLSFVVMPLVVFVTQRLGSRMKAVSRKGRRLISRVTRIIQETLLGIRVIKSFAMEDGMRKRNERAIVEHYRNVMREVRVDEFTSFFMECIAGLGVAIILWYGTYLIYYEKLAASDFSSYIVAVLMLYTPLKRLSRLNLNFQKVRTGLHRVKEILEFEDEKEGGTEKARVEGRVAFNHVSFKYPESVEPVLTDVNIDIAPGETVAVVGYSGAGKSTFVDLLLGFWADYSGSIEIDGTDIRQYTSRSLRSHIGVVSQDIILFDDTVRNNILFGRPEASDDEIAEAAKAAYAHDFIMEMPEGYDSQIGERGLKLSGGQKQRISLARAILKDPRIMVLDEATSSLDADSETKIQKALESIMKGRTTIIIAHRFSTISKADRIVVMDRGRIIQQGVHDELYSQAGVYQELYNSQIGPARD